MNRRFTLPLICLLVALIGLQLSFAYQSPAAASTNQRALTTSYHHLLRTDDPGLYDPRPSHIWNRLYRQFYIRTAGDGKEFGNDTLDPLLWASTKYLISGQSHQQAVALLDEFLSTHAEKLIADPLKRALFQRDLWSVFDWLSLSDLHQHEREELQVRLAQVIQRVALTPEQIKLLPDNYNAAVQGKAFPVEFQVTNSDSSFLPAELFRAGGPWVSIGTNDRASATAHLTDMAFAGRSVFLVFMRLPDGRDATIAYLTRLRDFPQPWILNPDKSRPNQVLPNPDLPQFPVGTELALVRRTVLIDSQGKLTPTPITESVQFRVYRSIPSHVRRDSDELRASQKGVEFRLSRRKLFAGENGGLKPVLSGERDFEIFRSHGIDDFDLSQQSGRGVPVNSQFGILDHCTVCHFASGIHSVLSFNVQRFQPPALRPHPLEEVSIAMEEEFATSWKRNRYEWGLLKGFWAAARR